MIKNTWSLYEWIDKNPNHTIYTMSRKLRWSLKKVRRHIKKLIRDGLIKEIRKNSPQGKSLVSYRSKTVKELINWDEMSFKPKDYNFKSDDND